MQIPYCVRRIVLSRIVLVVITLMTMPLNLAVAEGPPPTPAEAKWLELFLKPNTYFAERLQNPPEYADGGILHPKIQYYQEQRGRTATGASASEKWWEMFITPEGREQARRAVDRTWTYRTLETAPMKSVEDRMIDGPGGKLKIRIYTPVTDDQGLLPVMVHYHGGAWIFGSIEASDRANRLFANEADVIVVSVDYRLAPEYKFPAPQDDAQATFRWVVENARSFGGDPSRVGVGGDSAGGQMAVVTALRQWKDGGIVPASMMLYYPIVDMRTNLYSSYERFGEGYGLDKNLAEKVETLIFAKNEDREAYYSSPLQVPSLKGLPPTIIATANFDILRDQGRALADRLRSEGGQVIYRNYGSLTHGFLQHSKTIDDALAASVETARLYGQLIRGRYRGNYH
mgnify:CR=1 FL=1